jgi:hypothetical protein
MTTSNTIGNPTPPAVSSPPQPPPASLGALTDSEQRIWNTLVGDTGTASATQAIINSRALNAGAAAINSGAASTVTVTPKGDVTTVTTTPDTTKPGTNVTNTGTASATDTGVNVSVPVPSTTPVTEDDDAYVFTDANNKEIEVKTSEYDSWTPAQQLAWQTSQGLINSKPPVNTPSYVPDSTGKLARWDGNRAGILELVPQGEWARRVEGFTRDTLELLDRWEVDEIDQLLRLKQMVDVDRI